MKRRTRASLASSRTRGAAGSRGALEADEPTDERVVTRVRSVAVHGAQQLVETMFGRRERLRNGKPETPKPGRTDRDEQRFGRLDPALEIRDALVDELCSR